MRVRKELEKAERRATAQLMFDLGQKAYGRGMYGRAFEFLERALTIIPRPTLFGGEIQIWLAVAYEANKRHADCIDLYKQLENKHPSVSFPRQAAELRYIFQAPKIKITREEMLKVMDASTAEELAFIVRVSEVLEMLVCSLVSKMPLSETLLKLKSEPNLSNEYPNQGICIEPQTVGSWMNEEGNISLKLMIQDSSSSLKGSIEQLYKSVQDLDDEFFKSNYQKEILLNSKLYPGDSFSKVVTTYKAFVPSYSSSMPSVTTVPLKLNYCETQYDAVRDQGFLNGLTMFTITDNLITKLISPLFGLSVLNEMMVLFTDIEGQIVQIGKEEAFGLLVTSFLCDSSLTSVYLRQPKSKQ